MISLGISERIKLLQSLAAKPYTLPYKSIPGVISARALTEHLKLYQGYKDLLTRVDEKLNTIGKDELPKKHMPDHPFRALKEAETYALGGVILHELYFENLTNKPVDGKGLDVTAFIKSEFGSLSEWKACMRAAIMEARGWVVFSVGSDGKARILMMDAHNEGAVFYQEPLVVIDVMEHAYWMEFGVDRGGYADGVLDHLNWEEINRRYKSR